MDCCVKDTKIPGVKLVQTVDCFYPIVDDPYLMGKITCANVLSDLYAMGVTTCDSLLLILGVCTKFSEEEKQHAVSLLIKGFKDLATEAESVVTGGQTIKNPWMLFGGVASTVCVGPDIIDTRQAQPGNVIVLTKPLGTRAAVNGFLRFRKGTASALSAVVSHDECAACYAAAGKSMARLNRTAATLMHKYGATAATDVTGFGLVGHAESLCALQRCRVDFALHTLPVFLHAMRISDCCAFGLRDGFSPETSGGLLICLPADAADAFCAEIEALDGWPATVIGCVLPAQSTPAARITSQPTIVEIQSP